MSESYKCAYTELIELHKLQANPKNPYKHPEKQIEVLAKIIDFQGQRSPIIVSKRSGFIVKGHGRLQALIKLGWTKAAVDYQDYQNEAQEYADMVADNEIGKWAALEKDMFLQDLKDFDLGDPDLFGIEKFDQLADKLLDESPGEVDIKQEFLVIAECKDETEQASVFEMMQSKGIQCKII